MIPRQIKKRDCKPVSYAATVHEVITYVQILIYRVIASLTPVGLIQPFIGATFIDRAHIPLLCERCTPHESLGRRIIILMLHVYERSGI